MNITGNARNMAGSYEVEGWESKGRVQKIPAQTRLESDDERVGGGARTTKVYGR
jgi:hypothetical protein